MPKKGCNFKMDERTFDLSELTHQCSLLAGYIERRIVCRDSAAFDGIRQLYEELVAQQRALRARMRAFMLLAEAAGGASAGVVQSQEGVVHSLQKDWPSPKSRHPTCESNT